MPTQEEYEKATRELAKAVGARVSFRRFHGVEGGYVTCSLPLAFDERARARLPEWKDVFKYLTHRARHKGIPLPPSAEALLDKEAK